MSAFELADVSAVKAGSTLNLRGSRCSVVKKRPSPRAPRPASKSGSLRSPWIAIGVVGVGAVLCLVALGVNAAATPSPKIVQPAVVPDPKPVAQPPPPKPAPVPVPVAKPPRAEPKPAPMYPTPSPAPSPKPY